jgi:hypothetical protein
MYSFLSKKYCSKKLIFRHNERASTLTRQEYNDKMYVKNEQIFYVKCASVYIRRYPVLVIARICSSV